MSNCILGPASHFGRRHSARICTGCGSISVFFDGKACAGFSEEGDELRVLTCSGSMLEEPFTIKPLQPDTLQVSREGSIVFQIVERGEELKKMSPG
jgi:hypothetical protein